MDYERETIEELKTIILDKVIKVSYNDIVLSSGKTTKIYFDIRAISSNWYYADKIAAAYSQTVKDLLPFEQGTNYYNVGGPEAGGIPVMMAFILRYSMIGFWIRKQKKEYGMKQQIEGQLSDFAIIVDDIVTSGTTIKNSIKAIKAVKNDCLIIGVYPIIDRTTEFGEDLRGELRDIGINYEPIFSSKELIRIHHLKNL
jgi:orotate phosphoribosyltransferase